MSRFSSILVANRGEIALQVMKTARLLGYRTIAVYSEADINAPHVDFADDAVCIGPSPVGESYLRADRIVDAAKQTGAEAVHPGYGFLSENADFAKACADAGLVFIGPSAKAIELMGNKATAKRRMIKANVPCVPGYVGKDQSDEKLTAAASAIGFPVMVKAAAGGGGRGMRLVHSAADLQTALRSARSEARNAFGSDEMILEKAILRPRHVEVQVFADAHGNTIHLGERDCSVQRRHQKIIEEAPCPVMTPDLRAAMGKAAVDAAQSIGYLGAGTVEFLLDATGKFYFLEMNTRLQVEHPVTEMITGLDLVALQISVAQGDPLPLSQDEVQLNGHAIEARLYAEDPAQNFLPMTGHIDLWQPCQGEGVRIDSGIATGGDVSPYYDPMVAKVITWAPNRETAIARLTTALDKSLLFGTRTNKSFLKAILNRETFGKGQVTTAFIAEEFSKDDLKPPVLSETEAMIAAVLQYEEARTRAMAATLGVNPELANFSSTGHLKTDYRYITQGVTRDVTVTATEGRYVVICGETRAAIAIERRIGPETRLRVNGNVRLVASLIPDRGHFHMEHAGQTFALRNEFDFAAAGEEAGGGGYVTAPMHGSLLEICVAVGETVTKDTRLAVLEAMKMQHSIVAEIDGTVTDLLAIPGSQIAAGDVILLIDPATQH